MTNNVNVSLDMSASPPVVDVQDHGSIKIKTHPKPQTISWNLTGNLAQGTFVPMTEPEPGFEWVGTPPPNGVFDGPHIGANGKSLDLADNHGGDASNGQWIYRLRVKLGDTVYQTTALPGVTATSNNPIIINH